jgi:hypothetical protein
MMREKLIKLLDDFPVQMEWHSNEELADHLIANGVAIIETPKPEKRVCILWNPGHHGLNQRCEQMDYKPCSCNGDTEKCDYSR